MPLRIMIDKSEINKMTPQEKKALIEKLRASNKKRKDNAPGGKNNPLRAETSAGRRKKKVERTAASEDANVNRIKGAKKSNKRPKHRDPGAVERMMEFEKSLREAGFAKGGMANCGASVKPTQKSTKMMYGGMANKKK